MGEGMRKRRERKRRISWKSQKNEEESTMR